VKIEEDMLSIEDILESTPSFPFEINSRVHMASFVHSPHKVVVRKNIFDDKYIDRFFDRFSRL
jgi:hypothetical protein